MKGGVANHLELCELAGELHLAVGVFVLEAGLAPEGHGEAGIGLFQLKRIGEPDGVAVLLALVSDFLIGSECFCGYIVGLDVSVLLGLGK